MRFFFDNCISSTLAEAMKLLNESHHTIEHLTDRFPADADDVDWLPVIAQDPDLILVSADPTITSAKKEKEVWRDTGLTSFFFGSGYTERSKWIQVLETVRWWPIIVQTAHDCPKGSGFLLPFQGKTPKFLFDPKAS